MTWERHDWPRWKLPHCAGVYAVYIDGQLVYIGQSSDIANRIANHRFRFGYRKNVILPWNGDVPDTSKISLKIKRSKRFGDWAMWELRLIRRLKPIYNSYFCREAKRA
jgi:excinuclease UvrABC nuclease subunit